MTPLVHSRWGASGFSRVIACKGVIRQARDCSDSTNPAAELGTAAHECGEFALQLGVEADSLIGMVFNNIEADQEMVEAVQLYVSFIRNIEIQFNVKALLEQRVTISSIDERMFGTSDCVFIIGDTLHVYDYKHGLEVVEVKNNVQAIYYALGTLDTFSLHGKIKKVVTGIIQPRANHIDGSIRTHEYSIEELNGWHSTFAETFRLSNDPNSPLNAGIHCKYCLASGFCKPRIKRTIETIFTDSPIEVLTPEELSIIYQEVPAIKRNCKRIEEAALDSVRNGKSIEGVKLVNAIQRAVCEKETDFVKAAEQNGVEKSKLYNMKLKSMTDCKKILPHNVVNKFYIKPRAITTLAPMTDRRPAVSNLPSAVGRFNSVVEIPSAVGKFKNITEK